MDTYASIHPIDRPIPASRQTARRHYGVHPYFTRRPYNVVRRYVLHYSRERDRILDPFGGSGVTAIEAFLENRIGIHNDINPLANFITEGIANLHRGNISEYRFALNALRDKCEQKLAEIEGMSEHELYNLLKQIALPPNLDLPRNSDVKHYHDLFMPHQLASLAVLKQSIDSLKDHYAKNGMMLAWSATLTKLNRTFLSAKGRLESRGGSSIFSIYRFKVADKPVLLPAWQTFEERALNVITAKQEIDKAIELKRQTTGWHGSLEIHKKDILELESELKGQVDYIFTDPPYGGHISYLDLSTLWNAWIGIMPGQKARQRELIVGGELNLREGDYVQRLGKSIIACAKMLKPGRWMSIVFQHWNIAYFEAILRSAGESGMDLRAAISQIGDPIWSMHKKKGSESVLAGEMILTFFYDCKMRIPKRRHVFDVSQAVAEILDSSDQKHIYGEHLFNRIVIGAWHKGTIGDLNITRTEFADLIRKHGWSYDNEKHYWIRSNAASELLFREK